ncbi:uncharacterized protein LOC103378424 isoform X2 [Cynoglossus semilaevis]|uniref:uncharacterized protein LOC103378424 isoform X2 n=1 Tax=Cynoglossus semilaevis TaxID=244447 RepID=UPI000D6252F0|nr:uncharacterized protein LOC103378424 isoform X2 [Cynoglossus semilaevis]
MILHSFTVLLVWSMLGFVSCANMEKPTEHLTVVLGDPVTFNCTYNCSSGFVRGCWSKTADMSGCHGTIISRNPCTISLHLPNVSSDDVQKNYTCYTENTEEPDLAHKTQHVVYLRLEARTSAPHWTVSPRNESKNETVLSKEEDSQSGTNTGYVILPVITAVAIVLTAVAAFLWLKRKNQESKEGPPVMSSSLASPTAVASPNTGLSKQSERVTLLLPTADNDSDDDDDEVPYADIMITVRGVSTPELSQMNYLASENQREYRGNVSRSHLQATRSADRLHVPLPRDVSRKMSTNSEYAVITYA